jgi:hypothetical protein
VKRIWKRVVILTVVIGTMWFGTGKIIAQQQEGKDATVQAMERLAKVGEKTGSSAELTITSEDFPLYEGMKSTFSVSFCDGIAREVTIEVCDEVPLGDVTIYKNAYALDGKRAVGVGEYVKKSKESLERYSLTGGQLPQVMIRFPLAKGTTYEYQSTYGKAKAWVEGQEEVNTPAGKFMCLVFVQEMERAGTPARIKHWIAPGLGVVKTVAPCGPGAEQKEVRVLKNIQTGAVISNFDFATDPLVPSVFPKSRWKAGKGGEEAFSACELDTTNGAAGTAFSLKWSYHTKDTWVNVGLLLSGSWDKSVDLSQYDSISFYIKGSTERGCNFKIQSAPWKEKVLTGAEIPLKLTSEWQKVVIDLKTRPELKDINLTKTYTIELVDWDKEDASNVVWIDEIMLHKVNDKIKSEAKIDR